MESDLGIGAYTVVPIQEVHDENVMICRVFNVLDLPTITGVVNDLATVPLDKNYNDISQFHQSENLDSPNVIAKVAPIFQVLMSVLKLKVRETVEKVFNLKTLPGITATVSKYCKGDYLLCHDDRMGRRAVAFVLYLSEMNEEDGGNLRFFDHDAEDEPVSNSYRRIIPPSFNTLVLFRVNKTSHHEVEQIYTGSERISINGWFYAEPDEEDSDDDVTFLRPVGKAELSNFSMALHPLHRPEQILSGTMLSGGMISEMQQHMRSSADKALVINEVLNKNFFKDCLVELETHDLLWESKGPANFRFYETLPYSIEGPHVSFGESMLSIGSLVDMLVSPQFLDILSEITGVEYVILEDKHVPPTCMIEVQRWKEGQYSLLNDNNVERDVPTVEVGIYFKVNNEIIGAASDDSDLPGVIVQSSRFKSIRGDNLDRLEAKKMQRIRESIQRELSKRKLSKKQKTLLKKIHMQKLSSVVREKLRKLKGYRRSRFAEVSYLTPKDNTMIISFGSKDVMKYTSYIKKRDAFADPDVCYYAVSITYLTT